MLTAAPGAEFSRVVALARLGAVPARHEIAATAAECAALAERFGLIAVDRLTASVALERLPDAAVLLRARFEAEFTQPCVVSLDPVPGRLVEEFALRYGPAAAEPDGIDAGGDEPAFEPLHGDAIDIGEAVAQEFSLALPPFPRIAGAAVEIEAAPAEERPLAGLERLGKPPGPR